MTTPSPLRSSLLARWRSSLTLLVAGFALGGLLATHALAQSDPVVAKVNGVEIKESDLKAAEEDIGAQLPPMAPEAKKEYLITYLADMILVSKAAEAKKLGDTDDFKRKLAIARNKLLMEALLQDEAKAAVTDEAMKKVYAEAIKDVGNEQEVSARHILVETEDEAKKVAARPEGRRRFRRRSPRRRSKDPGSKDQGGDLGYLQQGSDGAGIRRSRLQARQGPDLRSGQIAIRLAHHPRRRQAHQAAAGLRPGQGPDRELTCSARRRPT